MGAEAAAAVAMVLVLVVRGWYVAASLMTCRPSFKYRATPAFTRLQAGTVLVL